MSQRVSDLVQENFSLRNRIWDMESRLSDLVKGDYLILILPIAAHILSNNDEQWNNETPEINMFQISIILFEFRRVRFCVRAA